MVSTLEGDTAAGRAPVVLKPMGSEHPSPVLVHDYLLVMRGAERTFAAIADCWPGAPISTLLYDPAGTRHRFAAHPVRTSRLQRLGVAQDRFRGLLPLYPLAAERLAVGCHELVISSSSAFAHGVRPAAGAVHVCYCHSPFRYAWQDRDRAQEEVARPLRPALRRTLAAIRRWDREASRRVTSYLANSEITRTRIAEFYGRDCAVVHPPVDVHRFHRAAPEGYFLVVAEIVRHKRVEMTLQAAARAGCLVKVVGTGPDLPRLRALYGDSAQFLGRLEDDDLARLYARAQAVVVSNVEEFGIVAVEAQAAGRPVIAADGGGARETVIDGETGVRFPEHDADALAEVMRHTDFDHFDGAAIRRNAERFSTEAFQRAIVAHVAQATAARAAIG